MSSNVLDLLESAEPIRDSEALRKLYQAPFERALSKEVPALTAEYQAFIERSPFALVGTAGERGLDISPRGDAPGFVQVINEVTLVLPDRRGNNRLDTLENLVRDPRVSLLFMIPGIGETLRVKGRAELLHSEAVCAAFSVRGIAASSVMRVRIERVYFQCQKALARSALWQEGSRADRSEVPTAGAMLEAVEEGFDGASYDAGYPEHLEKTIY